MAKIRQVLLCGTNDDSTLGAADHAMIPLTKHDADFLLSARKAFREAVKLFGAHMHSIELFWWNAKYGRIRGYVPLDNNQFNFERAAEEPVFDRACSIESETVKIYNDGVAWSAAHKNGGGKDFFETPVLPWTEIERIAEAKTVKQLAGILPAAHFEDSTEEDATCGSKVNETA